MKSPALTMRAPSIGGALCIVLVRSVENRWTRAASGLTHHEFPRLSRYLHFKSSNVVLEQQSDRREIGMCVDPRDLLILEILRGDTGRRHAVSALSLG